MKIILVCVIIGIAFAEKPAPYPARGWKPQGQRLELPGQRLELPSREYGAPIDPNNVEFTTVSNEYGPPPATPRATTDDFLQVVPAANSFSQFRQQQNQQAGKSVINGRQFLLSPSFAPQFRAQQERLREQNFQNPKNDAQRFNVNFNGKTQQQLPQREYGVPFTTTEFPETQTVYPQNFPPQQIPNTSNEEQDNDDDDDQRPVIAIANAEAHERSKSGVNLLAASQQGQVGQYYILLPDSSLQKVRFATGQNEDDRKLNGFSAQLKYSPVEPIRDPVFGYDEQGKIFRLYK